MRLRRALDRRLAGDPSASIRAIMLKSKRPCCSVPTDTLRLSGVRPASERTNSARRMSVNLTIRPLMSLRTWPSFSPWTTRQACARSFSAIASSQSMTSPSADSARPALRRASASCGSPAVVTRSTAIPHKSDSRPVAPLLTARRISCSTCSSCRRMASPGVPAGTLLRTNSLTMSLSERARRPPAAGRISTSGKS